MRAVRRRFAAARLRPGRRRCAYRLKWPRHGAQLAHGPRRCVRTASQLACRRGGRRAGGRAAGLRQLSGKRAGHGGQQRDRVARRIRFGRDRGGGDPPVAAAAVRAHRSGATARSRRTTPAARALDAALAARGPSAQRRRCRPCGRQLQTVRSPKSIAARSTTRRSSSSWPRPTRRSATPAGRSKTVARGVSPAAGREPARQAVPADMSEDPWWDDDPM